MGNTVISSPREECTAARLDTVIVTAHLNAEPLDTESEERKGVSVSPSGSFPVTVCIRPASEIPARIESAESPVEANCQLLRRSQPEAYRSHGIENTVARLSRIVCRETGL